MCIGNFRKANIARSAFASWTNKLIAPKDSDEADLTNLIKTGYLVFNMLNKLKALVLIKTNKDNEAVTSCCRLTQVQPGSAVMSSRLFQLMLPLNNGRKKAMLPVSGDSVSSHPQHRTQPIQCCSRR